MEKCFCKYCGTKSSSVAGLTSYMCAEHPLGLFKGRHVLYEGTKKAKYTCKYCGTKSNSIAGLTGYTCVRHPLGKFQGQHEPAL